MRTVSHFSPTLGLIYAAHVVLHWRDHADVSGCSPTFYRRSVSGELRLSLFGGGIQTRYVEPVGYVPEG